MFPFEKKEFKTAYNQTFKILTNTYMKTLYCYYVDRNDAYSLASYSYIQLESVVCISCIKFRTKILFQTLSLLTNTNSFKNKFYSFQSCEDMHKSKKTTDKQIR